MKSRADHLTTTHTAFADFADLIFAGHGHYFPSLQTIGAGKETAERAELADLYDQAQEARGDLRRAFRWGRA